MRKRFGLATALAAAAALIGPSAGLATFPGSNGRIVYDLGAPLFTVGQDGQGPFQLTGLGFNASQPSVSADGDSIAFARTGSGGYGIWRVNADGSDARQVTLDPSNVAGNDNDPAWSPSGSQIAFVRSSDLYVMNSDGSGATNLTSAFASSVSDPDWSPDGSRIAFAAGSQIWVMGAGGTPGPTQLNPATPGNRGNPSWSPDGTRIAYTRGPVGANGGIWTINVDGTQNEAPLVITTLEVWEGAFSSDGTKIAFIQDNQNPAVQEELFTVNADGTGLTQLNVDTETTMDWGPQGRLGPVPPPVLGRAVNVDVVRGQVLVAVRGRSSGRGARASQKGCGSCR